ncbi:hypothetical protein [Roseofilum sp. Belize Diploria]|uniref:hypothetical protein n=1 Tax=Roseofilum sp. Belize Diploria TaxID=2821501 RepID=UPI001B04EA0E|nr:hypothetical protein [Roseofilum sp. Belize Diploria]MBP0010138.1 hypothetical protein [Roseofilum sp. Belize Diploria]
MDKIDVGLVQINDSFSGQNHLPQMDRVEPLSEWETIESKGVFSASPWIELFVEKVKLPDGTVIDDYHQIQLGNHVAIVPRSDCGSN